MKIGAGLSRGRKLSKRELFLIIFLVLAVEGYLLFTYLLSPSIQQFTAQLGRTVAAENEATRLRNDYSKKDVYEAQLKEINSKLEGLYAELPSYVSQEEIIGILDKTSKEKNLALQIISFDNTATTPEGMFGNGNTSTGFAQSGSQATDSNVEQLAAAAGAVVANQQVSVGFSGNYTTLYGFLDALEKNTRRVYVTDLSVNSADDGLLNGTMKVSFISFVDKSGNKPFEMDVGQNPGKQDIFAPFAGNGTVKSQSNTPQAPSQDFYMIISNYLDNAPKVVFGEYPKADTEIYANANAVTACKLTLTGTGGTFSYSYTVGGNSHTGKDKLTVKNGAIRLQVLSSVRKSAQDKVGVVLDVDNQTGYPLEVTAQNEDAASPRLKLGNKTGDVKIK